MSIENEISKLSIASATPDPTGPNDSLQINQASLPGPAKKAGKQRKSQSHEEYLEQYESFRATGPRIDTTEHLLQLDHRNISPDTLATSKIVRSDLRHKAERLYFLRNYKECGKLCDYVIDLLQEQLNAAETKRSRKLFETEKEAFSSIRARCRDRESETEP